MGEVFGEVFKEVFLCPEHNSIPAGVRLGPIVFAAGLASVDPCTGALKGDGLEAQLRGAFENMERFLEEAGSGKHEVARVTVFMSDLAERQLLNVVWSELYPDPDDRPPHKYVPAVLPPGHLATVQVMAVASTPRRRVIELESVHHNDPMSMAALTANLVTSSRVVTGQRVEDADEHTQLVFGNVAEIMEIAGGDFGGITQITAFVGGPEYRENIERELTRRLGQSGEQPKLHLLEANLGGGGAPRLEILGLV